MFYFNTNKPHRFFRRIPVVLESRRSSRGGGRTPCTLPPPRSAPVLVAHLSLDFPRVPLGVFSVCSALATYQRKVSPVLAYPSFLSKLAIFASFSPFCTFVEKTVQYNVIAQIKLENNNMKKAN